MFQPTNSRDCKRKHRSCAYQQARQKFVSKMDEVKVTFIGLKETLDSVEESAPALTPEALTQIFNSLGTRNPRDK